MRYLLSHLGATVRYDSSSAMDEFVHVSAACVLTRAPTVCQKTKIGHVTLDARSISANNVSVERMS